MASGVGNVWMDQSYVDFSDPDVRAKFINPDGTWIDLGYYGDLPTGSFPLNYLTVQTGNTPDDILFGYGQDGGQSGWNLTTEGVDPDTGDPYPDMSFDECATPPPVVGNLELTLMTVQMLAPSTTNDWITLTWSDDAGASWSNGILKSMGAQGEYFTTPAWYRLGMSRNRIYELSWSSARAEALQGVFVDVTIAAT